MLSFSLRLALFTTAKRTRTLMPYYLYIERVGDDPDSEPSPIPLEEWRAAVVATKGVRLFAGHAHSATIPSTGDVISIRANAGDVEVYFAEDHRWDAGWDAAIYWHKGRAGIPTRRLQPGDKSNPVWVAAVDLASYLGAVIRGEEGEFYDLQTGKMTRTPRLR
jgi:hypothetical protein